MADIESLLKQIQFLKSAADPLQCPPDHGMEVAFAGRSNAGKSSALNALAGQRKLARTSKTPGRTQLINVFALDDERRLVDLPGYGYAKVPEATKRQWQDSLDRYLRSRKSLRGLVLVTDIRHPDNPFDTMMLNWAVEQGLPVHMLLTKADKLNRGPAKSALLAMRKHWSGLHSGYSVQLFSALKMTGVDELKARLGDWLEATADA